MLGWSHGVMGAISVGGDGHPSLLLLLSPV